MSNPLLKCVLYLRMSSDEQAVSIRQQREECLAYCRAKGYDVVGEYLDEGKSGSRQPQKRTDFLRLLRESSGKTWQVVCCWNKSRFGRLDSIDASLGKDILRKNGVILDTVKEGVTDWTRPEHRMIDGLLTELNHIYSVNLGADSVRGKADALRNGSYPHGSTPYALRKVYTNGVDRLPAVKGSRKPKNWRVLLEVDDAEAEVVRWLFAEYAARDTSFSALAAELNARGVRPPNNLAGSSKGRWNYASVGRILGDQVYAGTGHLGTGRRVGQVFNRAAPAEHPGMVPAVVPAPLFNEVQAKVARERERRRKVQAARSSPLSGVLVCDHCGYRMQSYGKRGREYFVCSSPAKRPHLGCHQWRVSVPEMVRLIATHLVENVDYELLRTVAARPPEESATEVDHLEAQAGQLRARVGVAAGRFLDCPAEAVEEVKARLAALKRELVELEERVALRKAVSSDPSWRDLLRWWEEVRPGLIEVSGENWLGESGPAEVRLDFPDGTEGVGLPAYGRAEDGTLRLQITHAIVAGGIIELAEPVYPQKQPVLADPDAFRAFLHKLGVEARVRWRQVSATRRKARGSSMFEVESVNVRMEVDWHSLSASDASCAQRMPVLRLDFTVPLPKV